MNEVAIRDRLVEHGQILLNSPKRPYSYTHVPVADVLLNDLDAHPHAFVLACAMDRQIKAEKAWLIPHLISEKLGGFSIEMLAGLSQKKLNVLMLEPEKLHRFPEKMASILYLAIRRIADVYAGDAGRIWNKKPSSAEAVYRFLEFDGVGPKIATMAVNLLARNFKIPFSDYFSVDISADSHVRRVFGRLGLCPPDPEIEQVIYRARALYPEFPGIMDSPAWEIGRTWCDIRNPKCHACYMKDICPSAA